MNKEAWVFSYSEAFSRNIGWLTSDEQQALRGKRVAIAGMGGVGGSHLLTLARLGVGAFHIADFDSFEVANFNRQAGASLSSLNCSKVHTLAAMAREINPELDLRLFPEGVGAANLDSFLAQADVYVDGLDFFAFEARQAVFEACAAKGIPAVTAAPLGMGAALLNFLPGGMSFEQYFRIKGLPQEEQALRFLVGLAPALLHRTYLVDPSRVDLRERRGPSTVMACQLCAGMAATEVLKILLRRGAVAAAPVGMHYDAYRNRFVRTWRPWGNGHPLQRAALAIMRRQLGGGTRPARPVPPPQADEAPHRGLAKAMPGDGDILQDIMSLARWAPSGDNAQVWRFELAGPRHLAVHGFDNRAHSVYDFRGMGSRMSLGALIETAAVAAAGHGWALADVRRSGTDERPRFDLHFESVPGLPAGLPASVLRARSVQRKPMHTRPLSEAEKSALQAATGPEHRVVWMEGWPTRLRLARFMFRAGEIRLTSPEAYRTHCRVIEWNARYSRDRMPDQALGASWMTRKVMRWAMGNWPRVDWFNRYLAGTLWPRFEMDFLPGLLCGAHFAIVARQPARGIDDQVAAGRAMQRLWLTATHLGLQMQPQMAPLIFSAYVRTGERFSDKPGLWEQAVARRGELERLLGGESLDCAVFLGRIGAGPPAKSRSLRLSLSELMADSQASRR